MFPLRLKLCLLANLNQLNIVNLFVYRQNQIYVYLYRQKNYEKLLTFCKHCKNTNFRTVEQL